MDTDSLQNELTVSVERLHKLGFNHTIAPLESPIELRTLRRSIAKMKTELRAREIAAQQ
ncbi:UNVERIFIED_CONTAM: hypothetical protein GTU68_063304 [Idotea baltica]|nr:hypothetical protein [Idotea baltica]